YIYIDIYIYSTNFFKEFQLAFLQDLNVSPNRTLTLVYHYKTTMVTRSTPLPGDNITQSPTRDPAEAIGEGIILIIICLFAFFGNTLLCTVILRTRSLRNSSTYLILCLSISDIVVTVVNMPMTIYAIFYGSWPFSKKDCVVLGYINMVSFIASVMSLTAISLNRYFRICRSLHFKSMFTFKKTMIMAVVVWIVSCLLAAPPLFGWSTYEFLDNQSFCFCNWTKSTSYTFFMIGMCFCVPCSVMSFCYVRIITSVRNSNRRLMSLDQRLSASYVDMESENQKPDSPPMIMRDTVSEPERLRNGIRIHADSLCAKQLTDYATTLQQNLALQQKQNSTNGGLESPLGGKCPRCQDPSFHPVLSENTIHSDSDDNMYSPTRFGNNASLVRRNVSCETILNVSSPDTGSPIPGSPPPLSPNARSSTLPASFSHVSDSHFSSTHDSYERTSSVTPSPIIQSPTSISPMTKSPQINGMHIPRDMSSDCSDGQYICENDEVNSNNVDGEGERGDQNGPPTVESDSASQDRDAIQLNRDDMKPVTFQLADKDEENCDEDEVDDSVESNESPGESSQDSSSELIHNKSKSDSCTDETLKLETDVGKYNGKDNEESFNVTNEDSKQTTDENSLNKNDMKFKQLDGNGSINPQCTCWSQIKDNEASKSCSFLNNSSDHKPDSPPPIENKRHETVTERPQEVKKRRVGSESRYNLRKIFSLPTIKIPLENSTPRKSPGMVPMKRIKNSAEGRRMRVKMSSVNKSRNFVKSQNNIKKALSLPRMRLSLENSRKSSSNVIPLRHLRRRREEIRITFSLLVVIIVFFVSWLPFCITMLCSLYLSYTIPRQADIASLFFGYANSCFNPLIYGLMNKRFSDAYKDLFKFLFYRKCTKK
ncbi:uncharacterized protein LOC115217869, partial [Argonauta hians]